MGVLPVQTISKARCAQMLAWLFVVSIIGSGIHVQADNVQVANGNKAGAHIDFVIIIPETLSLEIVESGPWTASLYHTLKFKQRIDIHRWPKTTFVNATGNLSAGATMAVTVYGIHPFSDQNAAVIPISAMTWTSGRLDTADRLKQDASAPQFNRKAASRIHTYQNVHLHYPDHAEKAIIYTLSSP